jgi:hypothetical protein
MKLREDPRWEWFAIRVVRRDDNGIFVFHPDDGNWLLTFNFWSAFVGGPNTDVRAALRYQRRYLLFPISASLLPEARPVAEMFYQSKTDVDIKNAAQALRRLQLAHMQFEITDYGLDKSESPHAVKWVRFQAILTFPPSFRVSDDLPVVTVTRPEIPDDVIENLKDQKKFEFSLPQQ